MLSKKMKKLIRITLFYSISWIFCLFVILFDPPFFQGSKYLPALKALIYFAPIMWALTIFFEIIIGPKGKENLVESDNNEDEQGHG